MTVSGPPEALSVAPRAHASMLTSACVDVDERSVDVDERGIHSVEAVRRVANGTLAAAFSIGFFTKAES